MTAGDQREEDELRPKKGSVGGPMLLWHAPGNIGHTIKGQLTDLFIDHAGIKGRRFKYLSCK